MGRMADNDATYCFEGAAYDRGGEPCEYLGVRQRQKSGIGVVALGACELYVDTVLNQIAYISINFGCCSMIASRQPLPK